MKPKSNGVTRENTKHPEKVTPEQAIKIIEADKTFRAKECSTEIEAVLKKWNCSLMQQIESIDGWTINAVIKIKAN